jgi:prolyl oligopeptidase
MSFIRLLGVILAIVAEAATVQAAVGEAVAPESRSNSQAKSTGEKLHALLDAEWQRTLRDNPTFASRLGDLRYNKRWPEMSLTAIAKRHQHRREVLDELKKIDRGKLSKADRLHYRLFRKRYETDVEAHPFRWHLLPLTQRGGIQNANELADALRFDSVKDYEDWIARMQALPAYVDQTIDLMRAGIEAGMVHPKVVMKRVPAQIARQTVQHPTRSLFFKPFRNMPDELKPSDRERLKQEAKQVIAEQVIPAYRKMQTFFEKEYLPACLDRPGIWQLPRGRELYEFRARKYTTTDLTPKEIHEIGLKEVRRIRKKMQKIIKQVKFEGSFQEFLEFLRTDPQFYYTNPNDLLAAYRAVCKKVDPQLIKLFRKLPRMPYGVESIPLQIAPDTTTAYYRPPAADGSRAGSYFVNLYKPEVRPKYEIEVLSLHEAVPGHHLQISLAMELEDLPAFRRYSGYTAFVEGWGLYSESLGEQLGLYRDPYSKFGQLTYEMWRAVRLVIDTGIHYDQWSRRQAIDYFAANAAKTLHDIENEVDRYIAWPGQALAYKIGELKIQDLRARAQRELGDRFDIRDFHDVVLSSGAVTLDVLETNVEDWIVRTKK